MLINPEFHHGNILVPESEGMPSIVDCGLIGEIKKSDIDLLFKIISGYKSYGIYGAAANILKAYGYNSMADIRIEYDRNELIESIKIIKKQIEIGVAPELLLSSLVDSISKILNIEVTEGIDTLFRALQHLAPYLRKLNGDKGDILDLLPKEDTNELALELKKECEGHSAETAKNIIPKGIAVGKKGSGGKVVTIGVLIEDADISKSHPQFPGMIALTIEGSRQLVKLGNLMVQIGQEWKPAAEFLSKK
jgi:hypothetical protein